MMWSQEQRLREVTAAAEVIRKVLRAVKEDVVFFDDYMPDWTQNQQVIVEVCWACGSNSQMFAEKVSEFSPNSTYATLRGDFAYSGTKTIPFDFNTRKTQLVIVLKSETKTSKTIDICLYIPKEEF